MGRLIEALWDCKYCGTKGVGGSLRECPNCGKPRDDTTKFYLPGKMEYVSEEKAKTINRNPDWHCLYCDSLNSDTLTHCESCGAERTTENEDYFSIRRNDSQDNTYTVQPEETVASVTTYSHEPTKQNTVSSNIKEKLNGIKEFFAKNKKLLLAIPLVLALVVGMLYLVIPKQEEITITDFKWERSIEIQRFQTVKESDWSLPARARLLYQQSEFSHYTQVIDHYETRSRQVPKERLVGYEEYVVGHRDLGNGYFEEITSSRPIYETYYETETYEEPVYRDEPVYRTKYYYEIDKWLYERTISTSSSDQNPYWGEVTLKNDERISAENEAYYVIGINKKSDIKEYKIPYEDWINLETNQSVKLKVSSFGTGEVID